MLQYSKIMLFEFMIFPLHIDKIFGKTLRSAIDKSVVLSVLRLTPVLSSISLNPEDFTPESAQKSPQISSRPRWEQSLCVGRLERTGQCIIETDWKIYRIWLKVLFAECRLILSTSTRWITGQSKTVGCCWEPDSKVNKHSLVMQLDKKFKCTGQDSRLNNINPQMTPIFKSRVQQETEGRLIWEHTRCSRLSKCHH